MLPTEFVPDKTMFGLPAQDIENLLRINREEALYRFFLTLIPKLATRGYTVSHILEALAALAYRDIGSTRIAHLFWDAKSMI
jgi:hypothetical protein